MDFARSRKTARVALVVAALAVVVAACSGPATSSASPAISSATPVAATTTPAGSGRPAVASPTAAGIEARCDRLTVAEVQPLASSPITQQPAQAVGTTDNPGQTCDFTTEDDGTAVEVMVPPDDSLGGDGSYASEVASEGTDAVAIPGVGESATRKKGDVSVTALAGGVYCSVTAEAADMPGIGDWELAHGGTSNVPESIVTPATAVIGTLCNRVYGSGNTQPDLAALQAAVAAAG